MKRYAGVPPVTIGSYGFCVPGLETPLCFAVVSDVHNFPSSLILNALRSISPDAVLIPGDFIQSRNDSKCGLEFLRCAASTWPVYCSSGKEHDFEGPILTAIEETGAVFLRNQAMFFRGVWIGGLNTLQLMGQPESIQQARIRIDRAWLEEFSRKEGYKLLLCHHPEYYVRFVREYPIDLILAGHAHGGQWRILGRGIYAPGQGLFPRYTAGLYDDRLLVNRGLGNSHWIPRINNGPELLKVELSCA